MLQDLRFAIRTLAKNPIFTLVAVLTLALGMGANTAVFSMVYTLLLKPLPFPGSDRLVMINNAMPGIGIATGSTSVGDYDDYRRQAHLFEYVAAMRAGSFILNEGDRPERLDGVSISASFFPMLAIQPLVGRVFTDAEDTPEGKRVVVLDERVWKRRFGGDPRVIGRMIRINGEPHTVLGVIPATLSMLSQTEVFVPNGFTPQQRSAQSRGNLFLTTVAKLQPGVSFEQMRREMAALASRIEREYPDAMPKDSGWHIVVRPLSEALTGEQARTALLVLLGSVGFVLLIACANVANLLLARATARSRELTIRASLGASRLRIARQLLTESAVLGLAGGVAGLLVGVWVISWFVQSAPRMPRVAEIGLHPEVLLFTFVLALGTSLLFGLFPVLRLRSANLVEDLKEAGRGAAGSLRKHKMRSTLVVAEVALSVVLLVGAGLLVQSIQRLQQVNPGFEPRNLLTFRVTLPAVRYGDAASASRYFERLVTTVSAVPGVVAAGATSVVPFGRSNSSSSFEIEGRQTTAGRQSPNADVRVVTPGFFEAMRIPLQRGRLFTEADRKLRPAVIDAKLAKQFWPNEDPVGKRFHRGGDNPPWFTIVGVVGHIQHADLNTESKGAMYLAHWDELAPGMAVVARTAQDPKTVATAVPRLVAGLDKDLPAYEIRTMEDRIGETLAGIRVGTSLISVFAVLATLLAAVGLYGVIAQTVSQRTQEIGIRMALGAAQAAVMKMIVGQALVLIGTGVAAGLVFALGLTKLMRKLLFGVSASDPVTYFGVAFVLFGVALLAAWIPARRATRIEPTLALRYE